MKNIVTKIELSTDDPIQVVNLTDKVNALVKISEVKNGQINLISNHTTASININECEEKLQKDMVTFLKRFVPKDGDYQHNINTLDGRDNAHSHLMGMLMNASETIPLLDGEMVLGKWQSIFFIELDGPRDKRSITIQIIGE